MSFISDLVLASLCLLLYILTHKLIQKDQVQELRVEIEELKIQEFTEKIEELVRTYDEVKEEIKLVNKQCTQLIENREQDLNSKLEKLQLMIMPGFKGTVLFLLAF